MAFKVKTIFAITRTYTSFNLFLHDILNSPNENPILQIPERKGKENVNANAQYLTAT